MITTGIIREININSKNYKHNKYKVELNIFQVPGDTDKSNYTFEANCMVASGFSSVYNIGDKVYVSFLNNDKSYPIILGKIYQGLTDEYRGYGALTDLKVKTSARLPNDTHIGQYTYQDFDLAFKKLSTLGIESINSIVTLLEKTPVTKEQLQDIQAKVEGVSITVDTLNDSLATANTKIAEMTEQLDGFSDKIKTELENAKNTITNEINDALADANSEIDEAINAVGEKLADLDETGVVAHVTATNNPHNVTREQLHLTKEELIAELGAETIDGGAEGFAAASQVYQVFDKVSSDLLTHTDTKNENPHRVTKAQIGLGNVNNTADKNKPVSTAQQQAINDAIDSIRGTDSDIAGADTIYGANKAADAAQGDATQALADAKAANDAIAIINGADTQEGSIAKAVAETLTAAKTYADTQAGAAANKADDAQSAIDTHADKQDNPHKVTAEQVGLGKVENKTVAEIKTEFTGDVVKDDARFVTGDAVVKYVESKNYITAESISSIKDIYFKINNKNYTCKAGTTWADFSAIWSNSICQCLNNFVVFVDTNSAITDDTRSIYVKPSDYILENKEYNCCDIKQLNVYMLELNSDDSWSFSENPLLQITIPITITWDGLAAQLDDSTIVNKKSCFLSEDNLVYVHIFDGNLSSYKFVKIDNSSGKLEIKQWIDGYQGEKYKDSISVDNYAIVPYNWVLTNSSN